MEAQTCSIVKETIGEYVDYGDHNDEQCIVCKAEDFKHMYRPNFGEGMHFFFEIKLRRSP